MPEHDDERRPFEDEAQAVGLSAAEFLEVIAILLAAEQASPVRFRKGDSSERLGQSGGVEGNCRAARRIGSDGDERAATLGDTDFQ